jgi:hypothetical protein
VECACPEPIKGGRKTAANRRSMKFHFIYKTTNTLTGKFYVGMHSTNTLSDGYFGSGVYLRRSLRKYGKENHTMEILEIFPNRELLVAREAVVVSEELLQNPFCMNLKLGGIGGFDQEMRDASYVSRRERLANDPEYRERISTAARKSARKVSDEGRRACSDALKARYADPEFKERQRQNAIKANAASHESRKRKKLLIETGKDKVAT